MSNTSETQEYRASAQVRERVTAILSELHANRAILDELVTDYNVFRFRGGEVTRGPWHLVAITSYVEHPFAADRILTSEAESYCDLAEKMMALGQAVAIARPRTLRQRWALAKTFAETAVEIRSVGGGFEAALANLLQELGASPTFAERMHAFGSGEEEDFVLAQTVATTADDEQSAPYGDQS